MPSGLRIRAARWAVNGAARRLSRMACRVDDQELDRVPTRGPLLLVCNHVNFLEVPLIMSHLQPRQVTGFAKAETWDSPMMGLLFDIWGAIPIRRGEPDVMAIRRVLEALEQGMIVAIAPEGTRSGDGCLRRAKPGIGLLAARSCAPILPIAYYGHEGVWSNLRRLRRTDFHIRVGRLMHVHPSGRWDAEQRQMLADEVMYQIAALLPEQYRGVYASPASRELSFLKPIQATGGAA